jgi:membrane-associated protease RseP (regulator of RpoE activity)
VSTDPTQTTPNTSAPPVPVEPGEYTWTAEPVPVAPLRPKFQHRYGVHVALFAATFLTTTYAQPLFYLGMIWGAGGGGFPIALFSLPVFLDGLWYSVPLLTILACHEFGHYLYCRKYNVDATLPYFLPAPFLLTGTFGAVIRIKERIPTKRALFDIGIAGPIGGFLALVPLLFLGVLKSELRPMATGELWFGEPLLFQLVSHLRFGVIPDGLAVGAHPLAMAAWWGMLATSLNLLPFGQLDGGHIIYALFGKRAARISMVTLAVTLLLTLRSMSWIAMTIMMLVMAFFLGFKHPPIGDETESLDRGRKILAACALIIFVLCFTPVPIELFWGDK